MGIRAAIKRWWDRTSPWEEIGAEQDMLRAAVIDQALAGDLGRQIVDGRRAAEVAQLEEMLRRP